MFKSIKNMFDTRQEKVEWLAAHIFVTFTKQCPPTTAARAAFDYAEAFMHEMEKRRKRNELQK